MSREIFRQAEERLAARSLPDALRLYGEAERLGHDPDCCAAGRWTCHMLAGNFPLAWRESEAIERRGKPDPHRFWDGRPADGRRVLVRCLHGLGDTIQFVRYVPLLRRRARSVAIEAQPRLKPLLAGSGLADRVLTWGEPEPPWDQQIEVIELPRMFGTSLASIPCEVPYLAMHGARGASAPGLLPPFPAVRVFGSRSADRRPRVGVVWSASDFNPSRSVPFHQFARLFDIRGISFFSLQGGEARFALTPWSGRVPSLCDETGGILRAAQDLKTLDLVVTVDTMLAHLAGALACPVWTLLPFACDWRWMLDREDSPWYPSMRLFRQPRPGDWDTVIGRVYDKLSAFEIPETINAQTELGA